MKIKIFIAVIILLSACLQNKKPIENSNAEQNVVADTSSDKTDTSFKNDTSTTTVKKINDSSQQNYLKPGSDTLSFALNINNSDQHLVIPLQILSAKKLFAILSSDDKKANIRINQIELPDSTFDGPFGRSLEYKIKTSGNYKLIIGENMMAGDRWKGNFILKVWVK